MNTIQAYADFIENRVQVDRADLIDANIDRQWTPDADDDNKMRMVDSFVGILVSRGLVTDDGNVTTWI